MEVEPTFIFPAIPAINMKELVKDIRDIGLQARYQCPPLTYLLNLIVGVGRA